MLVQSGLPMRYWPCSIQTAAYLLNCLPTKRVQGRTPHEAMHGFKPDVSHLRVFGPSSISPLQQHTKVRQPSSSPAAHASDGCFLRYTGKVSKRAPYISSRAECVGGHVDTHSAMISSDVSSSGCPFMTAGETVRTENLHAGRMGMGSSAGTIR